MLRTVLMMVWISVYTCSIVCGRGTFETFCKQLPKVDPVNQANNDGNLLNWGHMALSELASHSICSVSMSHSKLERVDVVIVTNQTVTRIKVELQALKHSFFNTVSWLRSQDRGFCWQQWNWLKQMEKSRYDKLCWRFSWRAALMLFLIHYYFFIYITQWLEALAFSNPISSRPPLIL